VSARHAVHEHQLHLAIILWLLRDFILSVLDSLTMQLRHLINDALSQK